MDGIELLVFAGSLYVSYRFLFQWYRALVSIWPPDRSRAARNVFWVLPVCALGMILCTLKFLAAFDVVNDFIYILFYVALGCAWLSLGMLLLAYFFDLSWIDDALQLNNKAALIAIAGGFLGLTPLYCGANVGDGPGWWCVVFAGGLGLVAWFGLGLVMHKLTRIFERITVERNLGSGIRAGFYLLSSGIILARACAGDWTSFSMTVVEFMDGWPVLVLAGLAIITEWLLCRAEKNARKSQVFSSLFLGLLFVFLSVASVLLLPSLRENPLYGAVPVVRGLHL